MPRVARSASTSATARPPADAPAIGPPRLETATSRPFTPSSSRSRGGARAQPGVDLGDAGAAVARPGQAGPDLDAVAAVRLDRREGVLVGAVVADEHRLP